MIHEYRLFCLRPGQGECDAGDADGILSEVCDVGLAKLAQYVGDDVIEELEVVVDPLEYE